MFIGLCIIAIVEEWKTNLMSLAIYFTYYALNMFRTLIYPSSGACDCCCWITTSVVLFSVRCVLEIWCGWYWVVPVLQAEAVLQSATQALLSTSHTKSPTHCASVCNTGTTQYQPHQISNTQRTENKTTDVVIQQQQSQAPEDGYINVRNMLSA